MGEAGLRGLGSGLDLREEVASEREKRSREKEKYREIEHEAEVRRIDEECPNRVDAIRERIACCNDRKRFRHAMQRKERAREEEEWTCPVSMDG